MSEVGPARVVVTRPQVEAIEGHARAWLPDECCGLIAGEERIGADGVREKLVKRVFTLTNTDHSPEHFTIDPLEQLAATREARAEGLAMLGNFHSHPSTPARQSEEDKRLSYDHAASYLIVSMAGESPDLRSFHFDGERSTEEELVVVEEVLP